MQKELLVQTLKFFISRLIPAILLTLINSIYSRNLSMDTYGSYQAVWTYLNLCVIFTAFGFPKYILTAGNAFEVNLRKKLVKIFVIALIFFLIPIAIFLFFHQTYFNSTTSVIFIVLLISQTIYFIQESFFLASEKSKIVLLSNVVYGVSLFLVHLYVLFIIPFQLDYCVFGITIVSIIRNIYLVIAGRTFNKDLEEKNQSLGKSIDLSLLFWLGLNDAIQMLTKWMDKLLLLFLLTASEFAIYFNGTFELPLIGMVLMSFQTIITIYGAKRREGDKEVVELFNKSSLFMSSLLFPLFAWMFFFSHSIILVLFGNDYAHSSILFQLSSLMLPLRICSYTVLLQLKNKGRIILVGGILDFIMTMLLMFVLYPILKLNGLVLAVVLGTYIQVLYYLWAIKKAYDVNMNTMLPLKNLIVRLLISLVLIGIVKIVLDKFESVEVNFLISAAITFCIFIYFIFDSIGLLNVRSLFTKTK